MQRYKRECESLTPSVSMEESNTIVESEPQVKVDMVSDTETLHKCFNELKTYLLPDVLLDMMSNMKSISCAFKGDGAGLSGGIIIDMFVIAFLSKHIQTFKEYHNGESDCIILDNPFSIKKIQGKSTIALDWSKNKGKSKQRKRFETDILIINLKTEQWWKTAPVGATKEEIDSKFFSSNIKAGIYVISHIYCKNNICLSSNNKTNSLIDSKSLYRMLKESIRNNMVIELPTEVPIKSFNILNAFEK